MRRFSAVLLSSLIVIAAVLSGCGKDKKKDPKAGVPTSISLSTTNLSLNAGSAQPITAVVLDGNNDAIVSAKVTFTASSPAVTLTPAASASGAWVTNVCAGTWDAANVNCAAGAPGTAEITASSGSLTAKITVFVHSKVDRIVVSPASVDCKSQGQTQQFAATVFSGTADITSSVGPLTWNSTGSDVVTVDANGVATAKAPGKAAVFASVSGVNSLPAGFVTCPVQSITVHVKDAADTSFTIDRNGTKQLAADVLDGAGAAISATLTWVSSQPGAATVNNTGLVTGLGGFAGITATCVPPGCNQGLNPAYSNVVVAQVNGAQATTVYATGTDTTSLIPIDSSANTAGTAITLPAKPNSFVMAPGGAKAFLGSDQGLMTLDTSNNSVSNNPSAVGKVLAVAPDGQQIIVAGSNAAFLVSGTTTTSLPVAGATAAAFSADSQKAYIIAGSTLYSRTQATLRAIPLNAAASDVAFLASGALGLVSGSDATVSARAGCNDSVFGSVNTPGAPALLESLPNASAVLAVDSPGIDVITPPATLAGCPPTGTLAVSVNDFGQGAFTARQVIVLPSGAKAYVTSDQPQLLVYDVAGNAASTIPLAGGASAFTGGATLDSTQLYVGGSDNAIHRIEVASGTDAQQIAVAFKPDLVVVRLR